MKANSATHPTTSTPKPPSNAYSVGRERWTPSARRASSAPETLFVSAVAACVDSLFSSGGGLEVAACVLSVAACGLLGGALGFLWRGLRLVGRSLRLVGRSLRLVGRDRVARGGLRERIGRLLLRRSGLAR